MNDGQWDLARISALHLRLPDLPPEDAARKFNPNHLPAGPGGGQFTSDADGGSANDPIIVNQHHVRVGLKPGVSVVLPNGRQVADPKSPTGKLMSPAGDLTGVAAAGRDAGDDYRLMVAGPGQGEGALEALLTNANVNVGQGGTFDYQRRRDDRGFVQYPQFRSVANFNAGLFMQQTGVFSLDETLSVAGGLAVAESSNRRWNEPHFLDPVRAYWIRQGYLAGESGVFGRAANQ